MSDSMHPFKGIYTSNHVFYTFNPNKRLFSLFQCVINSTVNSMVLFSSRLVGWIPADLFCASVVLFLEISGESPFSSRACQEGKLGSRLNRTGRFPMLGLPAALLPSPFDWKDNALFNPSTNPLLLPPLSVSSEPCNWLNFSMHSSIRAGGAFL